MKKFSGILLSMIMAITFIFSCSSVAYAKTALKITKQPASVTAASGKTAKVSFKINGDSHKYQWHTKKATDTSFALAKDFTCNTVNSTTASVMLTHSYNYGVVTKDVNCTENGYQGASYQSAALLCG